MYFYRLDVARLVLVRLLVSTILHTTPSIAAHGLLTSVMMRTTQQITLNVMAILAVNMPTLKQQEILTHCVMVLILVMMQVPFIIGRILISDKRVAWD